MRAEFEHAILRELACSGLAHVRQNSKRLGRPITAAAGAIPHDAHVTRDQRRATISDNPEIANVNGFHLP